MNVKLSRRRAQRSLSSGLCALSVSLLPISVETAKAEAVDTEILLLVDTSRPGMNQAGFDQIIDNYSSSLSSSAVLSAIQSGQTGSIAISLMYYGNTSTQIVGVPWMKVSNAADAADFASLASASTRPNPFGLASVASALPVATQSFGSETGAGSGNGFESVLQVIEVVATGLSPAVPAFADAAKAASQNALGSGVDVINSIAAGLPGAFFESFYANNVIGSTVPGVAATSQATFNSAALSSAITSSLVNSVQVGADASIGAVPEPSVPLYAISSAALLLSFRRRS